MKFASATLRTFTTVHTWVGLVAGFALFVAFYAGAITVFHDELQLWQASATTSNAQMQSLDDAQHLLDETLQRHPKAREYLGMLFPSTQTPQSTIYWQDVQGVWQYASLENLQGSSTPPHSSLSALVNELHYSLGLPIAGTYLMGIVSLLYGLALLSGLVIHLPKLVKDLFALRPGRNLKQFWQDAHNVIGVLSLPFHIVFAITGALLCLQFVLMLALNPLIFGGKLMDALPAAFDTAPIRTPAQISAPPPRLAMWHARSIEIARTQGIEDFEPTYLKLAHAGDANAVVEITGTSVRGLGAGSLALDASSGELLALQLQGQRDANHATFAAVYALHFGDFGNTVVRWLYFLLGLGGAFLFYSGNLLWIESRRKRRQLEQGRSQIAMARATVGICLGLCVALSASFIATQIFAATTFATSATRWTCFASWSACALWAVLRPPVAAAREILWLAAVMTAAIPLAHGAVSGKWFWVSAVSTPALFWIDATALVVAAIFASLAAATSRRAKQGEPNSVWSGAKN